MYNVIGFIIFANTTNPLDGVLQLIDNYGANVSQEAYFAMFAASVVSSTDKYQGTPTSRFCCSVS